MRLRKSAAYPVGATWRYVAPNGDTGSVWLAERTPGGREIWRWSFAYADGSGLRGDWRTTRAGCIDECRTCFYYHRAAIKPRFVRCGQVDTE